MTELLVGTRKGLFVLGGEPGAAFAIRKRMFIGDPVDYAMREPHSGRWFAAVTSPFWGPRIWFSDDLEGDWQPAAGVSLPKGGEQALKRIWAIVSSDDGSRLWAGGDPGVLFQSRDGGASWQLNRALYEHPTRPRWRPDSGGLSVHSIAPWPGDPDRLALAISAAGVWLTDDGGESWSHGNEGIVADYLPEQARATAIDLCVHHLERAPRRPERLYLQFHGGVYRSDDGGRSWVSIAAAREPTSSCTSARPRARSSARATPGAAGSASRAGCRRSRRCASRPVDRPSSTATPTRQQPRGV
ncbi:MAG: hypothetical protein QOD37_607 [Gaiellales bacterium]|nr:hypothetical protein [Gaiellales bacterium]